MKIGISTASLFGRRHTEDALNFLSQSKADTTEIFLESYCEYNKEFGDYLATLKGDIDVHSVHTLTTQFEPQLYSVNERAQIDSFKLLESTMQAAQSVKAKYWTFHGAARIKRTPITINFDRVATITQDIIERLKKYNVTLAYENVHWCYYNYVGFFSELRKRTVGLKGTLDIKQAWQSNISYKDLIDEMKSDIVTVHVSDKGEDGKMCLPGKNGLTDFDDLFNRLHSVGFDGAVLLEVYKDDFKSESELFCSVDYLKEKALKYYK
jgi:sugar phosphate isomerase/epimerase